MSENMYHRLGLLACIGAARRGIIGAACFWVGIGTTWILTDTPTRLYGLRWVPFISAEHVGILWITSAVAAVAFRAGMHTVAGVKLAWGTLIVVPTMLAAYFFIAWCMSLLPIGLDGAPSGITVAASYSAMAYLVLRLSLTDKRMSELAGDMYERDRAAADSD